MECMWRRQRESAADPGDPGVVDEHDDVVVVVQHASHDGGDADVGGHVEHGGGRHGTRVAPWLSN